jgi:hypothetical protein
MEALQRSTIPDIDNRPNNFLESITLRIENGHQLINERAEKLKATKKRDSPAKTSTKITPQKKRKKLKRTPVKDCAKESIASSSSSYKSSSSSSEDNDDDDEDEDTDTNKEPGNNIDDNDNDGNDNDDDNDDNDNDDNSDIGNDNDNDNDNDKDNNSGFMDQDVFDPEDDPEDGCIVTV